MPSGKSQTWLQIKEAKREKNIDLLGHLWVKLAAAGLLHPLASKLIVSEKLENSFFLKKGQLCCPRDFQA